MNSILRDVLRLNVGLYLSGQDLWNNND
jgi:hypothetical protein